MFKNMLSIVAVAGLVLALAFGASKAVAGTITDDFNTSHDYSGGNVTGTIWDGIRYNEGNIASVVADANTSNAGELTLASENGGWEAAQNDGLLLYVNVDGDFVTEVQATSTTSGNYNGVGLMARLADPSADGDAGEDWLFVSYSTKFNNNRWRNINNSVQTDAYAGAPPQQFIQLERSGDDFIFRRKASAVDSWAAFHTETRADLNGLPLQVGIWQGNFTAGVQSGTLDNFSLTAASIPEPAMLWRTDEADDWAGADWTNDGGSTFIAPIADEDMVVNSGTATVSTDVSATAAGSLSIARDDPGGTVEIAAAGTLAVTGRVNVGDGGTLNVDGLLSVGGMNVAAGGTLALGDDSSGDAGMLIIDNDLTDIQLTNITMGGGAMVRSTVARAPANNVAITVDGTLRVDGGNAWVGDFFGPDPDSNSDGDQSFTNLTLTETARYEWSFTKSDAVDEPWTDDGLYVVGTVNLADGLTIQLVDGGGSSAGIAGGVDVALFIALTGAVFDPTKITVLPPVDQPSWTWDTLIDGEGKEYPDLQFSESTLVLKGLVTGVVTPHAGDANDDKIVDGDDLVLFDQQFGGTPGTTGVDNCDFDGDGDVDIDDFKILKDEWGWQLAGAPDAGPGAATPEPATAVLLLLGLGAVIRRRRS